MLLQPRGRCRGWRPSRPHACHRISCAFHLDLLAAQGLGPRQAEDAVAQLEEGFGLPELQIARRWEEISDRDLLEYLCWPRGEHEDAVGQEYRFLHVMRHKDHGLAFP